MLRVELPKSSKGVVFPQLFTAEMNNFDVEELLPSLFFLIVARGRRKYGRKNDPKQIREFVKKMADSAAVEGFEGPDGERLLERWLRTSVLRVSAVGKSRSGEQIEHLLPLTLLTYKAGFPLQTSRLRKVDIFLYETLLQVLREAEVEAPRVALDGLFRKALGQGVRIGPPPELDGFYDGESRVDVNTFASLCFLEGLAPTPCDSKEKLPDRRAALPRQAERIGRDLIMYVMAYMGQLPQLALTRSLMALIDFQLFVYTMKLAAAVNELVATAEIPDGMRLDRNASPPEIYVDFTRERGGLSDDLAKACVERDLEALVTFYDNVVLLRTIDRFVEGQAQINDRLRALEADPPEYLRSLVRLRDDGFVQQRAMAEIDLIRSLNVDADGDAADASAAIREYFEQLMRDHASTPLDKVVALLADRHRQNSLGAFVKWFWSVGGFRKDYGLVTGNASGARLGRYAMSDDLLGALVQLAFAQDLGNRLDRVALRPRLSLRDFLAWLEERFGVVVARPPAGSDGASNRAAAKENLEALKRRLRQMGFYEDLSDDFTAQYLRNPFAAEVVA